MKWNNIRKIMMAVLLGICVLASCAPEKPGTDAGTDEVKQVTVLDGNAENSQSGDSAGEVTGQADVEKTAAEEAPDAAEAKRQALREEFLALANEVKVEEDEVSFTDANDKWVTIKKNPQKVYNLYASYTTLWYEAGGVAAGVIGGDAVIENYQEYIGRDITQDEGIEVAATTPHGAKWSVETIVAAQPDLIICSTALGGYKAISAPAEAAGIPVVAVSYDSFADYLKWYRVFTAMTGREDLWESVGLDALEKVMDVLMEIPEGNGPKVFIMFPISGQLQANTVGTVLGQMASSMGAVNIADAWNNPEGAERLDVNLETLYEADPDLILVQSHGGEEEARAVIAEEYEGNPVWQSLRAVKEDKVYYLSKLLFHNKPNSRFAQAYQIMAEILYPEKEFSFEK
ncbi:MAG: ABC transporter substrate-binding protein [Acetatifactor sp.]|nr:ABC transporter substrate-binding protein [Acetatifactor sp.]